MHLLALVSALPARADPVTATHHFQPWSIFAPLWLSSQYLLMHYHCISPAHLQHGLEKTQYGTPHVTRPGIIPLRDRGSFMRFPSMTIGISSSSSLPYPQAKR